MEQAMTSVYKGGVLLHLDVSFWRGMKPLNASDLGLQPAEIPGVVMLGTKFVIPKREVTTFNSIFSKAKYRINQLAFRFPVGDFWFLPNGTQEKIFDVLDTLKLDWDEALDSLLNRYDVLFDEVVRSAPDLEASLKAAKPTLDYVKNRFNFRWFLVELFPSVANRNAYDAYRTEMDNFLNDAFDTLKDSVLTAAIEVVAKVEDGTARVSSINKVRKAVRRFSAMNFFGDSELGNKLETLVKALPPDADDVTSDDVRAIVNLARTMNKDAVVTEYKRKVNWG